MNYWFFEIEFRSNFSFILFYWNIRFTKRVRVLIRDTFYNIKSIEELSMKFMKKEHVQHLATIMLAPQKKGGGYIINALWRTSKKMIQCIFFSYFCIYYKRLRRCTLTFSISPVLRQCSFAKVKVLAAKLQLLHW